MQERELSLIRDYEAKLLKREEENAHKQLDATTGVSNSLVHLSHLLRQILRSQAGEDAEEPETRTDDEENREPWTSAAASEYALERDIELARLEKENEELRRLLGLLPSQPRRDNSNGEFQNSNPMNPMRLPSMQRVVPTPREKLNLL